MSHILLDPKQLVQSCTSLMQATNAIQNANSYILQLERQPLLLSNNIRSMIVQLHKEGLQNQNNLQSIHAFVTASSSIYDNLEASIRKKARAISPLQMKSVIQNATYSWNKKIGTQPSSWKTYTNKISSSGYNSFTLDRGIKSLIQEGATISKKGGYALAGIQYENNTNHWRNRASLSVGNAEISGSIKAALKKEGVFDPNVTIQVGAEASAAKGVISSRYVHEYGEVGVNASAEVGVASAKAKAVISKKEVTIEGEVGAAAVRGEATGKISLFGISVTGSVSGEVGSVGASGKFSTTSNSVEFGGHLSFLFGAGFNLKIDY